MTNYIEVIGFYYQSYQVTATDGYDYNTIDWLTETPIPQATLDALELPDDTGSASLEGSPGQVPDIQISASSVIQHLDDYATKTELASDTGDIMLNGGYY